MIYPVNVSEFERKFGNEALCQEYLFELRYKNGFICEKCGEKEYWLVKANLYECKSCGHQNRLTAGTIFQDTHKPLSMWFRAMWWITSQKNGTSALGIQRILGIGSYRTAWTWLHKLRIAMVRPERDKLTGIVEIDEAFIGGKQSGGKRGRGTDNKVLVAVAVEKNGNKIGRIRLGVIKDASSKYLLEFIQNSVEEGSTINTDGWRGYSGLDKYGYKHIITDKKEGQEDKTLPRVHLVISLLKRWIMGTLQGSLSEQHMAYYLDEYTFRFNRRTSGNRGLLFYRLLEQAVQIKPFTYDNIVER
jgi:transposase-like protein/ribosomal protein L37AE/L43A